MADPYVIFPGTAGNYLSTPDVNLLDADTAHVQQSIGLWVGVSVGVPAWEEGVPLGFGDSSVLVTAAGVAQNRVHPSALVPVTAGVEYSFGMYVENVSMVNDFYLAIEWKAGGSANGAVNNGYVPFPVGGGWLSVSGVAPAGTDGADLVAFSSATAGGEAWRFGSACIREGSDTGFVPSLRIVGTLFEETVPADMPIVFAADGTPLTVGDGLAGDGYSYRRYDGADASAPLVAEFLASDIPVAAQLPA